MSYNPHLALRHAHRVGGPRAVLGVLAARRRRRRRAQRYCLWGHYGHLVQVGSQTDRYLRRRLKREAVLVRWLKRHFADDILPLKGDDGITYGPVAVYVAPVGTPFPAVDETPGVQWRRLA